MFLAKLNDNQKNMFLGICMRLYVNPKWLYTLIQFESGWNPKAKNPKSSAKGLIQFINKTAQGLGYFDSQELIDRHPTIESQLPVVEKYLKKYAPFPSIQSLFMSVFYPIARTWSIKTPFPPHVQKVNPGIVTVEDYIKKAHRIAGMNYINPATPIILIISAALFFF